MSGSGALGFLSRIWARLWDAGLGLDERLKGIVLAGLVAFSILWLLSNVLPRIPRLAAWRVVRELEDARANFLVMCVVLGLFFLLLALPDPLRWAGVLAALPPMMVLYQYVFNWLQRPRASEPTAAEGGSGAASSADRARDQEVVKEGFLRAVETIDRNYSLRTLFIRFGLPALLLLIEGVILALVLIRPDAFFRIDGAETEAGRTILRGARYGAVGAYVFVLLDLGRRSFRHDVTGGAALWAAVSIALGPLLAGTVALLFRLEPAKADPWQSGVVLFFTGFAPRRVVAAIEQAALQLLRAGGPAIPATRSLPLSTIRGMTPQIEERLAEEGVYNVETLAAAEPIRLLQGTSFDLRQILWWMDEALLIAYVPRAWQSLEDQGITGAIDLADLKAFKPETLDPILEDLAKRVGATKQAMEALIDRVDVDQQVRYVWTLYNRFTKDGRAR